MVNVLILVALIFAGVIAVSLMNNQATFAVFFVTVGFLATIIYLYMKREKHVDPVEELKTQLVKECFDPKNKLGYLYLSGGKQNGISHQERIRGKILGYTEITANPSKNEKTQRKPWDTLYVFLINPKGDTGLASLKDLLFSLPFLDRFKDRRFFAITPEQLGDNELTFGNIVVPGTATTTVGIFEMLNVRDLDKDYIMAFVSKEVARITLREHMRKLSYLVDKATYSDSEFVKTFKLIKGEEQQTPDYGIKR